MAGAGQSKQASENLKPWAGIFSCSYPFALTLGSSLRSEKQKSSTVNAAGVSPPTEKGQLVPNHKTSIVPNTTTTTGSFLGVLGFGGKGWTGEVPFFSRKVHAIGILSACLSVARIFISVCIFSLFSLLPPFFLSFSSRKESDFPFSSLEYAET